MKILLNLLLSVVVMVLFCMSITFIFRLGFFLFIGGDLLFSLEDVKMSASTGAILGTILTIGVYISNKLTSR